MFLISFQSTNFFPLKLTHPHRNGMDLKEAEDNKKRWQEYTEELYKKNLHNPDNHSGARHPGM